MPSLVCTMPDGMIFLFGSPSGRSTLITSAPYSARTAAAVGTNPCSATSMTRMPSSGRLMAGIVASSQSKYLSNLTASEAARQILGRTKIRGLEQPGRPGVRQGGASREGREAAAYVRNKECYFLYD